MPKRLAVLASGTGSLLEAMIAQGLPIALVIVDRECRARHIALDAHIPVANIPRSFGKDFDREAYTEIIVGMLRTAKIDLVAMAGFMTVFSPAMFAEGAYPGKIINTHPSLLPRFKGDHAVRDALAAGAKITGCTIHWATQELDEGPVIARDFVRLKAGDTVESLHERIKVLERKIYPETLRNLIA